MQNQLQLAGVPRRFRSVSFDDYQLETGETGILQGKVLALCRTYATHFAEQCACGRSLVFVGNPGTGKTMLASAIVGQVVRMGHSARYICASRLARELRDVFRKKAVSEQEMLDAYIQPDLFVLDEIGMQYGTDTERLALWDILNGRYENELPSILISNLTPDEMGVYISERIFDRLRENGGVVVAFPWDSFRSRKQGTPR